MAVRNPIRPATGAEILDLRHFTSEDLRPLLEQYGLHIKPARKPIKTLAGLTAYASAHGIDLAPKAKPAC